MKYGEVPSYLEQVFPEDSAPPPPLIEGETYIAIIPIFDADVLSVHFKIENGKVVELPKQF